MSNDRELPPFNAHGDVPAGQPEPSTIGKEDEQKDKVVEQEKPEDDFEPDMFSPHPFAGPESSPEASAPAPATKESKLVPVLVTLCVINLGAAVLLGLKLFTMSYYEIKDAPMIYYSTPEEIAAKAMTAKDPVEAQRILIERLRANNGIVLNENSVIIASPDFKMYPVDTINQGE